MEYFNLRQSRERRKDPAEGKLDVTPLWTGLGPDDFGMRVREKSGMHKLTKSKIGYVPRKKDKKAMPIEDPVVEGQIEAKMIKFLR